MYRASDHDSIYNRPAGEPDVWGDPPPSRQDMAIPPQTAGPPATSHRRETHADTTVEEFRSLARAIEERRTVLRGASARSDGSLTPARAGRSVTTRGHRPPAGGSAEPRAAGQHPAASNLASGGLGGHATGKSRFAQVHDARAARGAPPAHVDDRARPPGPARAATAPTHKANRAPSDPQFSGGAHATQAWIATLRESSHATQNPLSGVASSSARRARITADLTDLERMHARVLELEQRILVLEQAGITRVRTRRPTKPALSAEPGGVRAAPARAQGTMTEAAAAPHAEQSPRAPRRLWG